MSAPAYESLLPLGAEAVDLLFREARSASRFTDEPVSDGQLAAIWDLVRCGPTAFNEQPLRMVVVRSAAGRTRLARHLHGQNRDRAAGAPLSLVLAADLDFHRELPALYPGAQPLFDYMDTLTREQRRETALANTWLQIGYLIVGVRAAGLAAGPMSGYDNAALDRDFFPDGRWESLLVLNVGRALPKSYDRLPRLGYEQVSRTC
ncbi:malonic semialdehyde reductase [Actinoplanes sp. TFC3]|uniref:malonic semialdehyde reductase n=1 Tax=Actinoplanes sp. TFC3 TaxID=1710355 RepID=UPI0009E917FD|nr:malonic semialdehyde reductase [Actinoplanes sp. TFC3]